MARQINVAIVGCGYWGPNLVRNFSSLTDCTVRMACDKNAARLAHIAKIYPALTPVADFEQVLAAKDVHAVVVATPAPLHYPLAKRSLEAGKHVFIEKPMATTSRDCDELVRLADRNGLTLMVGHTFLYSAPVRKIKEILDTGELGSICYISSRRLNLGLFQKEVNVVWDLAPHDVSIICYLMGEAPCSVNCQGHVYLTPNVEDVSNMTLQFPGGGFATVHNSWLDPKKVREMTIVGTKRMVVYDDLEPLQKIRIYDTRVELPPHYDTFAEFQCSYHYGDMHAPRIEQHEALKVECGHFIDCIRSRTKPLTSGVEGSQLVRVLEAATESLRQRGARVIIASDGPSYDRTPVDAVSMPVPTARVAVPVASAQPSAGPDAATGSGAGGASGRPAAGS